MQYFRLFTLVDSDIGPNTLLTAYFFSFSRVADMKQSTYNNYFSKNFLTLLKIKKTIVFSSRLGAVLEQALTLPPAACEQSHGSLHLSVPQTMYW